MIMTNPPSQPPLQQSVVGPDSQGPSAPKEERQSCKPRLGTQSNLNWDPAKSLASSAGLCQQKLQASQRREEGGREFNFGDKVSCFTFRFYPSGTGKDFFFMAP